MSIVVTCENGHRLRAADSKAGTSGNCPACGAVVKIPFLKKAPTDSSILRLLGVGEELRRKIDEYDAQHGGDPDQRQEPASQNMQATGSLQTKNDLDFPKLRRKKICPSCDWEIDDGFKICPHCRHYFME